MDGKRENVVGGDDGITLGRKSKRSEHHDGRGGKIVKS